MSQYNTSTFSLGVEHDNGMVSEIQFMGDVVPGRSTFSNGFFGGYSDTFKPTVIHDEKKDDYEALDRWASLHAKPKGFTYHMPVVECKDIKLPVKDVDEHGRPNPDFQ